MDAKANININSEMLVVAREARGITQRELAKLLNCTQGRLSKIEMGIIGCSVIFLDQLAEKLKFPTSFFTQAKRIYGVPLSVHSCFRKRQEISKKDLSTIHASINITRFNIDDLLKSVDTTEGHRLPFIDPDEYDNNISEIARLVRGHLALSRGPVANLIKSIEDAGVFVILCDFGTDKVDGLSQIVPGLPPMIFIRKGMPGDRQRFTVVHELGHLVLHHRSPSVDMEEQANIFASEFLMPELEIKNELRSLSLEKLAMLKAKWKVSMQAILYRAQSLGVISHNKSRYLWMQLSKSGYRRNEPFSIEEEETTILKELIEVHKSELGYNDSELANVLKLNIDDYMSRYSDSGRTFLRIVS